MKVSAKISLALPIALVAIASEAPAQENGSGVEVSGEIEAGWRVFLDRPPFKDRAKFEEYGAILPGVFIDDIFLETATKDGYVSEFWGKHVGQNDQNYFLKLSKPGSHYLTFEWDQTPHLYSTQAVTLFDISSPAALTVPDTVQDKLEKASDSDRGKIINDNVHPIVLKVDRDTARFGFRYTPAPAWNFRFDYSQEERSGQQGFGTAINGFNTIELPAPVFYTTKNFGVSGEYVGAWAPNKKWSVSLAYNGSIFENKYESYTWDNPFRLSAPSGNNNTANEGRNSLPPDNQSHRGTMTAALDLPLDSRYVGTVSFSQMKQNEAFMPFTINPAILSGTVVNGFPVGTPMTNLGLLPARSLHGEIDEFLVNNVLTTRFSKDLTGTAKLRFLSVDNNTPLLFFPEYVRADGQRQNDDRQNYRPAYNRTTSSADLNWRAMPGLTVGTSYGWERYDRDNNAVDVTNEHSGRVFVDATPKDLEWLRLRASALHAERRYENYDALNLMGVIGYPNGGFAQNPLLRKFDIADRNRDKLDASAEFTFENGLVVTPMASWRRDDFDDKLAIGESLGLREEKYWNGGVELAFPVTDKATVMLSYLREDFHRTMVDRQRGGAGCPSDSIGSADCDWGSTIDDVVHTFFGTMNFDLGTTTLVPGSLSLKLGYIYSLTDNQTDTYPLGAALVTSDPPYPTVTNIFQRFDAVLKYTLSNELVQKLGLTGDAAVKLHYAYERNNMSNWATDSMAPYMIALDAGANRSLFMAATNPNYEAQLLALSFGYKW